MIVARPSMAKWCAPFLFLNHYMYHLLNTHSATPPHTSKIYFKIVGNCCGFKATGRWFFHITSSNQSALCTAGFLASTLYKFLLSFDWEGEMICLGKTQGVHFYSTAGSLLFKSYAYACTVLVIQRSALKICSF